MEPSGIVEDASNASSESTSSAEAEFFAEGFGKEVVNGAYTGTAPSYYNARGARLDFLDDRWTLNAYEATLYTCLGTSVNGTWEPDSPEYDPAGTVVYGINFSTE